MISNPHPFLAGGGDMGARIRAFDWTRTPLGPPDGWPASLKTTIGLLLHTPHPMCLWWGPELILFYNDGCRASLGADRHPGALGVRGPAGWTDLWPAIGPPIEAVMTRGAATWHQEQLLPIVRNGRLRELYWTCGYSPVFDDDGKVGGVLAVLQDQTTRVIGERRLGALRELAARASSTQTEAEAWREAIAVLAEDPWDLPFAACYVWTDDERAASIGSHGAAGRIEETEGIEGIEGIGGIEGIEGTDGTERIVWIGQTPGSEVPSFGEVFDRAQMGDRWPIAQVIATGTPILVDDLRLRFGELHGPVWTEPVTAAWVVPIRRPSFRLESGKPYGVLVAGLSPRLDFDREYREFVLCATEHIATAITNARTIDEERRRADTLAEIDRAKTIFFSDVSHELRTPLTLMLGPLAEALERTTDPDIRERLELAHGNTRRLQKLANTLLDFSHLEAGRMQASFAPTDLGPFTRELASLFASACEAAGLRLVVDCPPAAMAVYVDRDMWETIVFNLISNALKFTFEGEIVVAVHVDRGDAVLTVRDTGVGIPPHELARIFERFHRVRGQRARTQEGTGIGLSMVRDLVKMHGGTIEVQSVPHQGTTFTVTLPVGAHHLLPESIRAPRTRSAAALGSTAFVDEVVRWLPRGDAPPTPSPSPNTDSDISIDTGAGTASPIDTGRTTAAATGSRTGTGRLLLVDDNADLRHYLTSRLAERWQVEALSDGATALARVREALPDLVLCDVMMPGLNGLQLLQAMRADERTRAIPVIVLSARAGEDARIDALQAGADDYLAKPFSTRELIARIGAHLERSR